MEYQKGFLNDIDLKILNVLSKVEYESIGFLVILDKCLFSLVFDVSLDVL